LFPWQALEAGWASERVDLGRGQGRGQERRRMKIKIRMRKRILAGEGN
jgi:hypothetical protein